MGRPRKYVRCTVCGAALEDGGRHKATVWAERVEERVNGLTGEPYSRPVWDTERVDYLCETCHERVMAALEERGQS